MGGSCDPNHDADRTALVAFGDKILVSDVASNVTTTVLGVDLECRRRNHLVIRISSCLLFHLAVVIYVAPSSAIRSRYRVCYSKSRRY
ncbi:uncharacterized protein G2W53_030712 [Senna tora]|uniref:Uncharacterized protein n=1 Tax=Senna tora TaxID=362788 RepID=A0A834T6I0_9FABA|nr:uncharacterized protein G2W53_030712 [Senna tora]